MWQLHLLRDGKVANHGERLGFREDCGGSGGLLEADGLTYKHDNSHCDSDSVWIGAASKNPGPHRSDQGFTYA